MPRRDPKTDALPRTRCAQSAPGARGRQAFADHEFFDARDLVQVKYEMVRRVEAEGASVTDAAAAFGFSRPSFYQAQTALQLHGLAGFCPRSAAREADTS